MAPVSSAPRPAALPVAADRAVVANRIALLFSKQAAVGKALLPRPPTTAPASSQKPRADPQRAAPLDSDSDDSLAAAADPNAGAGYRPPPSASAAAHDAQDRALLRKRLLGARRKHDGGNNGRRRLAAPVESDSDDDQGRTALGKRKRSAMTSVPGIVPEGSAEAVPEAVSDSSQVMDGARNKSPDVAHDEDLSGPARAGDAPRQKKKKKRKKKKGDESL